MTLPATPSSGLRRSVGISPKACETAGDPAATERGVIDALLRHDLASFVAKAFGAVNPGKRYVPGWPVELLGAHLMACARGEITRLIVNLPPRSLKSIIVSVAWPAWLLGRDPACRIMAASYSERLAVKHALDCRHVLAQPWYRRLFPAFALAKDQNEKHKFLTTARGHRIATSVGGTVTGEGGDVLIVDDPLSATQAASRIQREAVLDWFDQTFANRLDDKKRGVIVVVMQRLHAADLTGHLLAKGGWEHLALPAEAPAATIVRHGPIAIRRAEGDPLWPAREGQAELRRARRELGSRAYAAQYQQNPAPEDGGLVRLAWFRRLAQPPAEPRRIVLSWDTATKGRAHNDPSVGGVWAETAEGWHLMTVIRRRMDYPTLRRCVVELAAAWRPAAVLIEDQASGQALIQDLRAETRLPVIAIRPNADKVTRFARVSPLIEAGRVSLPAEAPWLAEYEAELAAFPDGAHDDQVDMTSQFLSWATRDGDGPRIRRL
ncbi:MAG: phage terminase large subunit [Alphaproteobacteria bacterium]